MTTPSPETPEAPKKPTAAERIASLVIVYLKALQDSPGLTEDEYTAAETLKNRIATEL